MIGYIESDNFPSAVSIVADADPPCATDSGTAVEGLADRSLYIGVRTAPVLSDPTHLPAVTGMSDGDTRNLVGWGFYVYRSGSTAHVDGLRVVPGNAGVGRWLQIDYAQTTMRLMSREVVTYQGTPILLSSVTNTCLDPANRIAGNKGVALATSTKKYDLRSGLDILQVSYSAPFLLVNNATFSSDVVLGVSLRTGPDSSTDFYPEEFIENPAQTTATLGGPTTSNGIIYQGDSSAVLRFVSSKNSKYAVANNINVTVLLVAACAAHVHGEFLQGVTMSVAHYRTNLQ